MITSTNTDTAMALQPVQKGSTKVNKKVNNEKELEMQQAAWRIDKG